MLIYTWMDKKTLLDFIKKHKIGVISTVGETFPESSVVDFVITDKFEIIFNTYVGSRKYRNLQKNRHISFVIGWEGLKTVQYEGLAYELFEEPLERVKEEHSRSFDYVRLWKVDEMRYFKISPSWVKYSDYNTKPSKYFELSF